MLQDEIYYAIALTLVPQVGDQRAHRLVSHFGSAQAVFRASRDEILSLPGIGKAVADEIRAFTDWNRVEEEMGFAERHHIHILTVTNKRYPYRLRECVDAPVVLYYKGEADLNAKLVLSVIGTRSPTTYGRQCCEELIRGLSGLPVVVISGLAFGIDALAHRSCLQWNISTVGVLAHGLDRLYPNEHRALARKMLEFGGLLTDFRSRTKPDRQNFPKRNRIVAGLSDAVVVVETSREGGSMITANLAGSYNRDVYAFPARTIDPQSSGCLDLITFNKAGVLRNGQDLLKHMGWEKPVPAVPSAGLFPGLNNRQQSLLELIRTQGPVEMERLIRGLCLSIPELQTLLLELEMMQCIRQLPGPRYAVM